MTKRLQHAYDSQEYFGFDLKVYRCKGAENQKDFEAQHGEELWKLDTEKYDRLVKVEPQKRALREMDTFAWLNGRRRSQGGARGALQILEFDVDGRLKINPWLHGLTTKFGLISKTTKSLTIHFMTKVTKALIK